MIWVRGLQENFIELNLGITDCQGTKTPPCSNQRLNFKQNMLPFRLFSHNYSTLFCSSLQYLEKVATINLIPTNPTITLVFLLKIKTGLLSNFLCFRASKILCFPRIAISVAQKYCIVLRQALTRFCA